MILHFPNLDTLRLALTCGAVPAEVSAAAVTAGFDDQGAVYVQPGTALGATAQAELRKLGAGVRKAAPVPFDVTATCWPQLLPLQRGGEPASQVGSKAPVLFELPSEGQLPEVVGEILRLGNDRQAFRWLGNGHEGKALLRVIGPPYYTLLRAIDAAGRPDAPRAYVERHGRVWVALGYVHPLADQIAPPPGKLVLLRPPRDWTYLDEGKFRDIYEIVEFTLPAPLAPLHDTEPAGKIVVPLRLTRGGSTEPAELWVLRERGLEQLDELVKNADEKLPARLTFAISPGPDGRSTVVIRARPSKLAPPQLVLDGIACRPYLRLPNLFVPVEKRLHPPLRRDAVVKLLAGDAKLVTWLYPHDDGTFTPQSLPDEAFRPLDHWVDYVLDRDHEALTAWVQATRFDFEPYICRDDGGNEPKKPQAKDQKKKTPEAKDRPDPIIQVPQVRKGTAPAKNVDPFVELPKVAPSELQQQLKGLEREFLELKSPLDAAERQDLWRQMAQLHTALKNAGDATLSWAASLWELEHPGPEHLRAWFAAEAGGASPEKFTTKIDTLLTQEMPATADLYGLVAFLAWAGHAEGAPSLGNKLGPVVQFLEKHETNLPVRVVWLAWAGLVRLLRGDVLALARARDRVLERLHQGGLSPQRDLPGFLRFAGAAGSDRFRLVKEHLTRLRGTIQAWATRGTLPGPCTPAYIDLFFAYGLARLGEVQESHRLAQAAENFIVEQKRDNHIHQWIRAAYGFRINQMLAGKTSVGRLPVELLNQLNAMDRMERYVADRLREHSRILEPHEKVDPFQRWHGRHTDDLTRLLSELNEVNDRDELADRLRGLLRQKAAKPEDEARVLGKGLELAPRLGEAFSRELFPRVLPALDKLTALEGRMVLLEEALKLAAHFDQAEYVQAFVTRFHEVLAVRRDQTVLKTLDKLLGSCFRGLRKLGMRDEIAKLLERLEVLIQGGETLAALRARHTASKRGSSPNEWVLTLRLLMHVAAGWYYFGQDDRARPAVDEVRELLLHGELASNEQTDLACAYVTTLGQAPVEVTIPRLEEAFRKLERVSDTFTTAEHYYSLTRLRLVEATVLTLISDDFSLDRAGRRYLDDDEFLVRRRIHRDVRQALAGA